MGAQNGIIGDDFGIDLPQTQVPEQDLTVEKNMAKFSKTAEFKKLKSYLNERIAYYQTHLPGGKVVGEDMPTPEDWVVANAIIAEFKSVLVLYEAAGEAVETRVQR